MYNYWLESPIYQEFYSCERYVNHDKSLPLINKEVCERERESNKELKAYKQTRPFEPMLWLKAVKSTDGVNYIYTNLHIKKSLILEHLFDSKCEISPL